MEKSSSGVQDVELTIRRQDRACRSTFWSLSLGLVLKNEIFLFIGQRLEELGGAIMQQQSIQALLFMEDATHGVGDGEVCVGSFGQEAFIRLREFDK